MDNLGVRDVPPQEILIGSYRLVGGWKSRWKEEKNSVGSGRR